MKAKNIWLALVLTVVLPGLGYVYLARKLMFGLFLLVSNVAGLIWLTSLGDNFKMTIFFVIGLVAYYGAILLDTYYTATTLDTAMPMKADPVVGKSSASSMPVSHDKNA